MRTFSGFQCDNSQSSLMPDKDSTSRNSTCDADSVKRLTYHLCIYSKNKRSNMIHHFLVLSSERPYQCEICSQSFIRQNTLKRQLLIQAGEKPYSCNACNKSFNKLNTLKKHVLTRK